MKLLRSAAAPLRWLFFFIYMIFLAGALIFVREKLPLKNFYLPDTDAAAEHLYAFTAGTELKFQGSFEAGGRLVYPLYRVLENPQPGERRHQLEGFAFETESRTTAGPFRLLLFIDTQGALLDVRTVEHSEWLGMDQLFRKDSMIFTVLAGRTLPDLRQNEIPHVLGAVQISEAVESAVVEGLSFFEEQRALLMSEHPFADEPAEMTVQEKEKSFLRQIIDTVNPLEGLQIHESEFQDI